MVGEQHLEVRNWFGSIVSSPAVVVYPRSAEEIAAIMRNPARYPGPVRVVGSNHSTTPCGVAEGGTLVVMHNLNRFLTSASFWHNKQEEGM